MNGQVYAQPLVSGGTVFVVTETDNVYALDANTGVVQTSLTLPGTPFNPADVNCSDLLPTIGVTGTPVIDSFNQHRLLLRQDLRERILRSGGVERPRRDVNSLQERAGFPVAVEGAAANDSTSVFNAAYQHQRTGLLLMNGVIYAGFGSHCDRGPIAAGSPRSRRADNCRPCGRRRLARPTARGASGAAGAGSCPTGRGSFSSRPETGVDSPPRRARRYRGRSRKRSCA